MTFLTQIFIIKYFGVTGWDYFLEILKHLLHDFAMSAHFCVVNNILVCGTDGIFLQDFLVIIRKSWINVFRLLVVSMFVYLHECFYKNYPSGRGKKERDEFTVQSLQVYTRNVRSWDIFVVLYNLNENKFFRMNSYITTITFH